jgi:antitoxin ParD1/3/4
LEVDQRGFQWAANMHLSNMALPPDLAEFVRVKMSTGEYTNEGEIVREALTFLRERDEIRATRVQQLRGEIQIGIDEIERGESKPFDAGEIKAEVRRRLAAEGKDR